MRPSEIRVHIGPCDVLAALTDENGEWRLRVLRVLHAPQPRRSMTDVSRDIAMGRRPALHGDPPRLTARDAEQDWPVVEQRGQYFLNVDSAAQRQALGSLARTLNAPYSSFGVPVRFDAGTLRRLRSGPVQAD